MAKFEEIIENTERLIGNNTTNPRELSITTIMDLSNLIKNEQVPLY